MLQFRLAPTPYQREAECTAPVHSALVVPGMLALPRQPLSAPKHDRVAFRLLGLGLPRSQAGASARNLSRRSGSRRGLRARLSCTSRLHPQIARRRVGHTVRRTANGPLHRHGAGCGAWWYGVRCAPHVQILLLSAGTPHKPMPVRQDGFQVRRIRADGMAAACGIVTRGYTLCGAVSVVRRALCAAAFRGGVQRAVPAGAPRRRSRGYVGGKLVHCMLHVPYPVQSWVDVLARHAHGVDLGTRCKRTLAHAWRAACCALRCCALRAVSALYAQVARHDRQRLHGACHAHRPLACAQVPSKLPRHAHAARLGNLSLRRLVVITNEFHMARTRAIFEHVFGLLPEPRASPRQHR